MLYMYDRTVSVRLYFSLVTVVIAQDQRANKYIGYLPLFCTTISMTSSTEHWHSIYHSCRPNTAVIAKQTIEVDPELQPQAVKRTLSVEGNILTAKFETLTVRLARLTVNGFLENVDLVVRTLEQFGEDAEKHPVQSSRYP
ncbi:hypothetical protein F5146DRAFT_405078 [Armillaria mellea]|nr:hypothetical protein F5146DRAFT_405078 [Armillaria mellea]